MFLSQRRKAPQAMLFLSFLALFAIFARVPQFTAPNELGNPSGFPLPARLGHNHPMNRTNRLWIFFVIVAVGLVLSWGQVGREQSQRIATPGGSWLDTETPCEPLAAPCAAYGGDAALVVGPERPGVLRLKLVGSDAPQFGGVSVFQRRSGRGESAALAPEPVGPGEWDIPLPDLSGARNAELRVRFDRPAVQAAFPLYLHNDPPSQDR